MPYIRFQLNDTNTLTYLRFMKNLKLKLLATAMLCSSYGLMAQSFYVTTNVGYALGMTKVNGFVNNTTYSSKYDPNTGKNTTLRSYDDVPLSLGNGFNFGISGGYFFNQYLGVELGLNYLIGGETKLTYSYETAWLNPDNTIRTEQRLSTQKLSSNMFRILPSIVITPGFEKLNPYLKMGVVIGFGNILLVSESNVTTNDTLVLLNHTVEEIKFFGGLAFGFQGTIGADYGINEKIKIFAEANYLGYSYAPSKAEVIKYELNGTDNLPNLSESEKKYELLDSYTEDGTFNRDEPSKLTKIGFPYGSMSFNLGIKLLF